MPSAAALLWPVSTARAILARQVEMVSVRVWDAGAGGGGEVVELLQGFGDLVAGGGQAGC